MKYELSVADGLGQKIEVWQEIPSKRKALYPSVLLVPGFGADLHDFGFFDEISDQLLKNGYQVYRFSFAGCGESEGNFIQTTLDSQSAQLRTVIDYIAQDRFTDTARLGIMAHSFGVSVTMASLPLPEISSFLFSGSPAYPFESLSKAFKRSHGFKPEGISVMQRSDKSKTRVGPGFWLSLHKYKLVDKAKSIKVPALFIHGEKDQKVKAWEALEYYEAVKGKKRFLLIEKADHAYTRKFRHEILGIISDWFNETLE